MPFLQEFLSDSRLKTTFYLNNFFFWITSKKKSPSFTVCWGTSYTNFFFVRYIQVSYILLVIFLKVLCEHFFFNIVPRQSNQIDYVPEYYFTMPKSCSMLMLKDVFCIIFFYIMYLTCDDYVIWYFYIHCLTLQLFIPVSHTHW